MTMYKKLLTKIEQMTNLPFVLDMLITQYFSQDKNELDASTRYYMLSQVMQVDALVEIVSYYLLENVALNHIDCKLYNRL